MFSDVFSGAYRSFNLKRKSLVLKISVTVSLVFNYHILNEIISSTIVYDQDAIRSRGLY